MSLASLLHFVLPYGFTCLGTWLLFRVAGPSWVLGLFESEGKPSARIVLACVVVVFSLFMVAANRITDSILNTLLFFSGSLFGFGTGKVIAKSFASRPMVPQVDNSTTKIEAQTAPVSADTVNMNSPPTT